MGKRKDMTEEEYRLLQEFQAQLEEQAVRPVVILSTTAEDVDGLHSLRKKRPGGYVLEATATAAAKRRGHWAGSYKVYTESTVRSHNKLLGQY